MRSCRALAVGLLLCLGCQAPKTTMNYSPLQSLPPASERRASEGNLAIWALAAQDGNVSFYLLPPADLVPELLVVKMGRSSFSAEAHIEQGRTYFTWSEKLGSQGVLRPKFEEPMVLDAHFRGGGRRCMKILGLGTESFPVLHMCYFDLTWEPVACP